MDGVLSANKHRAATVLAFMLTIVTITVAPAARGDGDDCAPGNPTDPTAEMFATNATTAIVDPTDSGLHDRLEPFELEVSGTIIANAALPVGSDLNRGVFWSDDLQTTVYEPSRTFHIACVDDADLMRIAEHVAGQHNQESVLTFAYEPTDHAATDSFIAEISGVDPQRFRESLVADSEARNRIGGGSIRADGTLVLVAANDDAALAERVVENSGAHLDMSVVRHGRRAFVPPAGAPSGRG
jgi:hypothetical protein